MHMFMLLTKEPTKTLQWKGHNAKALALSVQVAFAVADASPLDGILTMFHWRATPPSPNNTGTKPATEWPTNFLQ